MEVIQGEGLYHTEPSPKDIGGQICRRKRRSILGNVISARDSLQISTNQEEFLILSPTLGLLFNGGWTLSALFLKPYETKSICWSAWITLLNRSNLNPWLTSETYMLRSLFGGILSHDLKLPAHLSRITDFNLIARPLGNTVQTWV